MQITNLFSSPYSLNASSPATRSPNAATSPSDSTASSAGGTNYDFTSMSQNQLQSTVNDLVKSGQLSLKDSSPLVTIAAFGSGDANTPIDVLSALKNGISYKQQTQANDPNSGIANWQNALATLQGLQGTRSGIDTYA